MTIIKKILAILEDGTYSIPQIAEKIGLDENNTRVYINRLKSRGMVIETGKDGRNKLFTVKPLPATEDSRKIVQTGKILFKIFDAHFKDFEQYLSHEERTNMDLIEEVLKDG